MKYRNKTLSLFKVLKVFDIIALVCSIIAGIGILFGLLSVILIGTNPELIDQVRIAMEISSDFFTSQDIDFLLKVPELIGITSIFIIALLITVVGICVMFGLILNYLNTVIKYHSPFNGVATKKLTKYGIVFVIMGAAISIIDAVIQIVAAGKLKDALQSLSVATSSEIDYNLNAMILVGLFCILINIIFKYGNELEEKVSVVPMLIEDNKKETTTKEEVVEEVKEENKETNTSSEIDSVSVSLTQLENEKKSCKKVVVIKRK